jgi:hypothetical protein
MGFDQPSLFRPEHGWEVIKGKPPHRVMVLGVSRDPIFLGRRKEKIVGLYPIYFVVTQALQHTEHANQLKVGETNFFTNFSSCCRFKRFVWFNLALWQDQWGEISLPCKGELPCKSEIYALVLLSQHNTASSDPFLDGWHTTIPGVINNKVLIVHLRVLLHTRWPNAPGELRPTGENARNTTKAYAVGRQLQWQTV